jgi:hypothetical protein
VTQQATIIAYANDFKLLMLLALVAMPLVLLVDEVHFLGFRFQCRLRAAAMALVGAPFWLTSPQGWFEWRACRPRGLNSRP